MPSNPVIPDNGQAQPDWTLNELKQAIQDGLDSGFEDYTDSEDVKLEGRRILAERGATPELFSD